MLKGAVPKVPWTVSVVVLPGDPPCPELEALDRALSKTRGHHPWDDLLAQWKAQIPWPKEEKWGEPIWIQALRDGDRNLFRHWEEWLCREVSRQTLAFLEERKGDVPTEG